MSPEKASICIVDDLQIAIGDLKTIFETSDHRVLLTVETKEDALEAVDQFEELGIDVVLLDAKLVLGDFEGKASQEVLDKIRSVAPNVKVITMSVGKLLEGGDLVMYKDFSGQQIIDAINIL